MFGEAHCNFPRRLAGNLWQEFFQFYPMDERKGLCFSVYYLLSDPLDASFSSIPGAVCVFCVSDEFHTTKPWQSVPIIGGSADCSAEVQMSYLSR
jgi:hypothetical protein